MGSGSSKGGVRKTTGSEVVADVILPGQNQAVTVRGRVAEPKTDGADSGSSASSFPDPSPRPLTASRPVSGRRSKTPMVASKDADFHRPSDKLAGSDQIRPKSASASKTGTATVTEVAPDRYTVEYDNQVFDISSGDFSSFLANTAEMDVKNTENVPNPFLEGGSGRTFQVQLVEPKSGKGPLQVQLPQRGGVDISIEDLEEDVEEILEPLENKENSEPDDKKSERKEQLRQALQVKKNQLSKEEYEQMIANHKQEVELMEIIRNKEKNRQKVSLEEKMNKRKLRKNRLAAEQREKNLLQSGQSVIPTQVKDDSELDENKKRELEAEIAKRNAEFERELQQKKHQLSEADLQLIIAEHKQNMMDLNRDLERTEERQKQALAAKLAARKAKKAKRAAWNAEKSKLPSDVVTDAVVSIASDSEDDLDVINDRIKRLQREIDRRDSRFATDVVSKKGVMSEADYQRLVDEHKKEMQRLVRKLEKEKQRQNGILQEKLGARQQKKNEGASLMMMQEPEQEDEARIAASEADDVERQLERTKTQFEDEMRRKRPLISEEEYQRLLAQHEEEINRLTKKLDRNKERQRIALLEKLANRKKKRNMKTTEDEERARLLAALKNKEVLTEEQLKLLEGEISHYSAEYEDELNRKRSQISQEEYDRLLAQHKKDVDELDKKLQQEKEKMRKSFDEKLAGRKARGKKRGQKDTPDAELQGIEEDINDIEVEMKKKQGEFDEKMKNRGQMSDEDYARLIAEHEDEMEKLRKKLERQKDRQRQKLLEKIAARKRKKDLNATEEEQRAKLLAALRNKEPLDEDQLKMLQEDIEQYDKDMTKAVSKKFDKGDMMQVEYEELMRKHQLNMVELQIKLRVEKSRLNARLAAEVAGMEGRKMSDNEDDDDFNFEPQLATETSLWTTPVQSQSIAMVPLLNEYPVRKKKELYTDPAIFREQDAHAIRVAQTVSLVMEPTFSSMVDTLVEPATSELQKVRLVFRWITAQNCQEMDLHDAVDDTPLGVLKGIYDDKITWSTLFMRMCRYLGLKCVEIAGSAKRVGYTPGQAMSSDDEQYHHTWNAVCIDNYWHFVDCNWGVSHIQEATTFDPFRYKYDEHYFLADPEVIIRTHFPNDPPWQLLRNPFTIQDFVDDIFVKPDFFTYGFIPVTHKKSLIEAENGDVELKLSFTKGYVVSCELFTKQGSKAQTVNGIPYKMYVFQQQVAENILSFYVRLPDPGIYYWVFYAKKHFFDGEINSETATEVCRYKINSHKPSSDRYPLPPCPLTHWGPISVEDFDLNTLSHHNAVIICDRSSATCQFNFSRPMKFHCDVTAYGAPEGQFKRYILHSQSEGVATFRFAPPVPGRFGFNLFILHAGGRITPFCSYLVVCREPSFNSTPFPYVPDNQWGPSEAFHALGLCTLSHHDPVIETSSEDLTIEIGFTTQISLAFTYIHHFQQYTQDITNTVFCEPQDDKITFLVFQERPGRYHLMISAADPQDQYGGKISIFNYLIIKE
ncbi:uncharacterized protein LOC144451363 isoform X2 [Glandiceps talaboti]